MSEVPTSLGSEDNRSDAFLAQQDLALDCGSDIDYRGHIFGIYLGRGKKGN
jgi:hypothetical protein